MLVKVRLDLPRLAASWSSPPYLHLHFSLQHPRMGDGIFGWDDTNSHADALHLTHCILSQGAYTSLIRFAVRYTQMLSEVCADNIAKSIRAMVGLGIWERPTENHKIKMPFGIKDDIIANNSSA